MKFVDYKIEKFINELESDMPAPGGGSVSGLISALSGALNSMVYSLTIGKKAYNILNNSEKNIILKFKDDSENFTRKSLELMDKDKNNFLKLMDSYKMPKVTEEEIAERKNSIRDNTIKAMEAPLEVMRESLKFYENLNVMCKHGNKMLLSDLQISAILLHSAVETSAINVKVNLNSLKDEDFYESIINEINLALKVSMEKKEKICSMLEKVMY